ncbi:putative DNA mismatch repair protein MutS, core [Dioscorea sansibarensis]
MLLSPVLLCNTVAIAASPPRSYPQSTIRACIPQFQLRYGGAPPPKSAVVSDSLRLLEWDKVCDAVSSFAGTPLGQEATKEQLWSVDLSYEQSLRLLEETTAAVEMIKYGNSGLDFSGVDVVLVKSAIYHASRGIPMDGMEARAVVSLIEFGETLQIVVKTAVKEDADWFDRFMPLTQMILDFTISRPFVKAVQQVIDEDGSVKDSASTELKRARDQVRVLERKLYQLMDKLTRNEKNEASSLEMCNVNGRWCLKTMDAQHAQFDGLLLSSRSGVGGLIEPLAAVSLNDELQNAIASTAKAEEEVLSRLTDKMLAELDAIQLLVQTMIDLDAIFARAKFSIAYGGSCPDLFIPGDEKQRGINKGKPSNERASRKASPSGLPQKEWKLYMPKAHHPLLIRKHHENLNKARKDVANVSAEMRRRRLQGKMDDNMDSILSSMKLKVASAEKNLPVPVDFMIPLDTGVLVITGPNTGGKTISIKTVGLASLMAKTGLYVLASDPVKIPWFDAIYADIGDEQSLTQSLSTFSGHLRQISAIRSQSSNKSLVLLDEVGAGTNPLEGAALGMSLLESFAAEGSYLTVATTHHGELKTLKYSNHVFENASVEFDEDSLRPTYKILWGVPGRSNAINIAERLGMPSNILDNARKLHGADSAEINEIILDMERCKQDFRHDLEEAQHYLMLCRKLQESLSMARQRVNAHIISEQRKKMKAISNIAAVARSTLRNKLQHFRESALAQKSSQNTAADSSSSHVKTLEQSSSTHTSAGTIQSFETDQPTPETRNVIPDVGDTVNVPSLGKQAVVLKVEASKGLILVQASNMKLRLKLHDIQTLKLRTKQG